MRAWDKTELKSSGERVGVHTKILLWCIRGK